jgi:hypothetical protein
MTERSVIEEEVYDKFPKGNKKISVFEAFCP